MYTNVIKSVTVPNDTTVVFTCTKPKANMLNMWVYIVPQHIWETVPGQALNGYDESTPIVGSVPFQLTSYKPGARAVMTANKSYWGGAPKIDEVDFVYYQNRDTLVHDLTACSLQGAWGPDADHCLVVGGCRPTTVLDQGIDDTLINVTKLPLPATASASPMGQTKRMLMEKDLP
jgi:ABC-type transport system substrate-binding protein